MIWDTSNFMMVVRAHKGFVPLVNGYREVKDMTPVDNLEIEMGIIDWY
jgi:hypothetical protein